MTQNDLKEIKYAKSLLENQSLAMKASDLIGKPIEQGIDQLPINTKTAISKATSKALQASLKVATMTMQKKVPTTSSDIIHKLASATSGASGGLFGIVALPIELPVSTTIIMRSIIDIARSEGEDINLIEAQLACIEVFALGGPTIDDDAIDTGYFTVRTMLSNTLGEAAKYISKHGLVNEGAPIIIKLLSEITSRFGLQVSQKFIVQSVPVIGACSGALFNTIFMDHFQNMAKGHFIIRRLERKYGEDIVKENYKKMKYEKKSKSPYPPNHHL